MDFRKTYYILPNLFTLSSVFCGFISISLSASSGTTGSDLYQAALAICFGFFFDTADGRVARLTKTQTDLGRDLDSLADAITFGVAPAMMVYKFGLTSFGRLGIFFAGLFVCAGVMRLARFNVLSRREAAAGHHAPGKYTLGLTIPAAASVLVLMVVVAHNVHPYRIASDGVVAAVVLVLSYLMVSRVKFRSFKDLRLTRRTIELAVLIDGLLDPGGDERRRQGAHLPGADHGLHRARAGRDRVAHAPLIHRAAPREGRGRRRRSSSR